MILELDCQVFCTTISARISTEKEIKTWKWSLFRCNGLYHGKANENAEFYQNFIKIFHTVSCCKWYIISLFEHIMTISTSLLVFISEQICVSFCEKRKRNKQRAEVRRLWQEISSIKHFPKTIIKHTTSKS